jgi:hypothetical protein
MSRPRIVPPPLLPVFFLPLLLLFPACASDQPGKELVIEIPETEAGAALASALDQARSTDRRVFVHTGADW